MTHAIILATYAIVAIISFLWWEKKSRVALGQTKPTESSVDSALFFGLFWPFSILAYLVKKVHRKIWTSRHPLPTPLEIRVACPHRSDMGEFLDLLPKLGINCTAKLSDIEYWEVYGRETCVVIVNGNWYYGGINESYCDLPTYSIEEIKEILGE